MSARIDPGLALAMLLASSAALAGTDTTPNPFSFNSRTNVPLSTVETSNAPTIGGINAPAPVTVNDGSYSIGCNGTFTTAPGSISNGQKVCVRQTSSASFGTAVTTTLSIGGVDGTFVTTTAAQNTKPSQFTFIDRTGVPLSTAETGQVTVTGINSPAPASVANGSYSVGCTGTYTTAAATVSNNQTVCVQHTSSASNNAAVSTTLTVGGVSDNFSSITLPSTPSTAGMLPFANGHGILKLFNPTASFAVSNPVAMDNRNLAADDVDGAQIYIGGSIAGTTFSNLHGERLAYTKASKIYLINLGVGVVNNFRNVSSIADACAIEGMPTDYANVDHSWMSVRRAGPDGLCGTGDDYHTMVKLTAANSDGGISPAGLTTVKAVHASTGAISGFLTIEGSPQLTLTHRDQNFANPVVILNLDSSQKAGFNKFYEQFFNRYYLELTLQGQTAPQLFSYDSTANAATVVGPLYTFANDPPQLDSIATIDASNFYFADGNLLLRMPISATTSGQAQTVASVAAGQVIQRLELAGFSQSRLVFAAFDTSSGGGVYSVLKTATGGVPTVLAASGSGAGQLAELIAVAPGPVYINLTTLGGGGSPLSALRVNDDGTSPITAASAFWGGVSLASSVDTSMVAAVRGPPPAALIQGTLSGTAPVSASFQVINAADGSGGVSLGTISSVVSGSPPMFAVGIGRYLTATVAIDRGGGKQDTDAYFLDTQKANSLHLLSGIAGYDDIGFGI